MLISLRAGLVEECFMEEAAKEGKVLPSAKSQGYKCVLNSKSSEDSQANLAKWEPGHGRFRFRHPWSQYLKVAAAMRYCAYCMEAFNGCISSEIKVHESGRWLFKPPAIFNLFFGSSSEFNFITD